MVTNTPNFNWKLPDVGGDVDLWGGYLNENISNQDTLVRAFMNTFIGTSAPATFQKGTFWLDTTTSPIDVVKVYDGTQWVATGVLNETTHTFAGMGIAAVTGDYKFSLQTSNHNGWIICDGGTYLVAAYTELFALIGYAFGGAGPNFFVPDLRGRIPGATGIGTGLTPRALGATVGEETHTLTRPELPDPLTNTAAFGNFTFGTPTTAQAIQNTPGYASGVVANQGGNQPHNNMQPTLFVGNFFIYSGA
jgi:microcystin-dependent protein